MNDTIKVYKNRTNIVTLGLGVDVSGETITSQIRVGQSPVSELIAEWNVEFDTDGSDGEIILTLDNSITSSITRSYGYMDIQRSDGGEPLSVFESPIRVFFQGVVTA